LTSCQPEKPPSQPPKPTAEQRDKGTKIDVDIDRQGVDIDVDVQPRDEESTRPPGP
jgi:hypothetical protein